jgi:tetratricopeptide (TPR) repeat protein
MIGFYEAADEPNGQTGADTAGSELAEVDVTGNVTYESGANYTTDELEDLVADYTRELRRSPDSAQLYLWRGQAYEELYEWELAEADYTSAIELEPIARHYEARAELNRWRNSEQAKADYDELIALEPRIAEHRTGLAYVYENLGQEEAAVTELTTAIELEPDDLATFNYRARLNLDLGNGAEAIADYNHLIEQETSSVNFGARGRAHEVLGNHDDALADYTEAFRLDAESTYYLQERARLQAKIGNTDEALYDYTVAIDLDEWWPPYQARGELLFELGQVDDALDDFDRAAEIDPIGGAYQRGLTLAELGRNEEALVDLNAVAAEGMSDYEVYNYDYLAYDYQILLEDVLYARATVRAGLGDFDGAAADLRTARELIDQGPRRPAIIDDRFDEWIEQLSQGIDPFADNRDS